MGIDVEMLHGTEVVGELPDCNDCLRRFISMTYTDARGHLIPPYDDTCLDRSRLPGLIGELQLNLDQLSIESVDGLNRQRARFLEHAIQHWHPTVIAELRRGFEHRQPAAVELEEVRTHVRLVVESLRSALEDPSIDHVRFVGD
jgi:hypothetical protein